MMANWFLGFVYIGLPLRTYPYPGFVDHLQVTFFLGDWWQPNKYEQMDSLANLFVQGKPFFL